MYEGGFWVAGGRRGKGPVCGRLVGPDFVVSCPAMALPRSCSEPRRSSLFFLSRFPSSALVGVITSFRSLRDLARAAFSVNGSCCTNLFCRLLTFVRIP